MDEQAALAARFEAEHTHLRSVAYRMLGSVSEADDAVQDAWFRLTRSDPSKVDNLSAWLTTVVARICLDRLRTRRSRREDPLEPHVPDPIVTLADGVDPEHQALLADSVGLALLVVLETLKPAERLAFVLHDLFAMPFDEVAAILGRSPEAARQLASRARRRVQERPTAPDADSDLAEQWRVVDAFLAAARGGDFEALLEILDPDVVLRTDGGPDRPGVTALVHGAAEVAGRAQRFAQPPEHSHAVLVNGVAGVLVAPAGRPVSVLAFTVVGGKVVAIDALADPERLASLDLTVPDS